MPPSMFKSEALVIWMFRIAMNAPIIAAITEIQTVALARSVAAGPIATAAGRRGAIAGEAESARSDMTSPVLPLFAVIFDHLREVSSATLEWVARGGALTDTRSCFCV